MANQIINRIGTSIVHIDTTADFSLANLKATDEATPVTASIIEIFWNIAPTGTIMIDRGGTDVYKLVGNASGAAHFVGHVNYRSSGLVLRGTNTADIGATVANFGAAGISVVTLIVKKTY
tara:strand:+ start:299 stop:658 length:360 start_codon:yes stop_codon:yes gene_type:complete